MKGVLAFGRANKNLFPSGIPTSLLVSRSRLIACTVSGGISTNASMFFLDFPAAIIMSILHKQIIIHVLKQCQFFLTRLARVLLPLVMRTMRKVWSEGSEVREKG